MEKYELEEIKLKNLDDIVKNVEEKEVFELVEDTRTLLDTKDLIETAIKTIKEEHDKLAKPWKGYVKEIDKVIGSVKEKALQQAVLTYREEKKLNKTTGELETKKITDLPKGFSLVKGRVSTVYKEDKIPEEYFDRVLNKAKVKKAIEEGKLDYFEVAENVEGESSITITKGRL